MSLNYEMARYTELTGEDGTKVSISRLGGYLDGYEKGRQDAIDEFYNALTQKRCECCDVFRNECCTKYNHCFIDDIAEKLKEEKP